MRLSWKLEVRWTAPLQLGSMQAKMKNVQAGIELTMVVTLFEDESIELSQELDSAPKAVTLSVDSFFLNFPF